MRVTDEGTLARAAAGGDGQAFAQLYDLYERKIFNFCLRLVGTQEDAADATQDAFVKVLQRLPKIPADRELNFGAYLFTAARNASYDVIGKRKRADAVEEIPEYGAKPLMADDTASLELEPERAAMMSSFQLSVQEANARLPERHREVLALRELDDLSYDEIAEIMGMNRNSVAQLISRARIKLRDELRGGALAAVAVSSAACERALPLIAARQDGQLSGDQDRGWLEEHLGGCQTCRVSVETMAEAGMSYRQWAPIVPMAWLWKSTAAKAMEATGFDFSDVLDRDRTPGDAGGSDGGGAAMPGGTGAGVGSGDGAADTELVARRRRRRRGAMAMLGSAVLLLGGAGVALVAAGDDSPAARTTRAKQRVAPISTPVTTAATTATTVAAPPVPRVTHHKARKHHKMKRPVVHAPVVVATPTTAVVTTPVLVAPVPPPVVRPKPVVKPKPKPKPSGGSNASSGGGSGSAGSGAGTGSAGGAVTGPTSTTPPPPPPAPVPPPPPPPPPPTTTAPADYCAQNPNDPSCSTACRPAATACPAPRSGAATVVYQRRRTAP